MLYLKNNSGFTLTELLIAVLIGSFVLAASTVTYIAQKRSHVAQESVSEVNTQSKIAHDLIANEFKNAGFGVPDDLSLTPINGFSTIITPTDSTTGTDAITIISGRLIGQLSGPGLPSCPGGTGSVPMNTNPVIIYSGTVMPTAGDNLSIDGVISVDVLSVSGTSVTLTSGLPREFPLCRPVYLIEDVTYCVFDNDPIRCVDDDGTPRPCLRRIRRGASPATCTGGAENEILAENIEGLQFAYAVDANDDGQIDDGASSTMPNALDAGDFIDGIAVADPADIRAIQINVLARTDTEDANSTGLGNPPTSIRNWTFTPTSNDLNFKWRWWQTIVTLRNREE